MAIDWEMLDFEPGFELFDAAFYWWEIEPTDEAKQNPPERVRKVYDGLLIYFGLRTWAGFEKCAEGKEIEVKLWELSLERGEELSQEQLELMNEARAKLPRNKRPPRRYVNHEQLREYADKVGKKPAFLFPDVRTEDKLHGSERNTYLRLIAALLEAQKIDPTAEAVASIIAAITDKSSYEPISDKRIREKILPEINALKKRK